MLKCWDVDPGMRPTFAQLKNEFTEMMNEKRGTEMYLNMNEVSTNYKFHTVFKFV